MRILVKPLKAAIPLTILTTLLSTSLYARDMPQKSFACQVQAKNGIQGLVLVQTEDRKMAFEAASRSMATTLNGRKSATIAVVKCIETHKEQFTDSTFQKFYEATPL